jgi:4-hydroxybenzoyl-CoA thioesterase
MWERRSRISLTAQSGLRHCAPSGLQIVPNFIHRRQLRIEWGHCDPAGIVFNARFFEMFDAGTWALLEAALGVPRHELAAKFDIFTVPLVDVRARFIAPVRFGDVIDHESQMAKFRRSSFEVAHRIFVGDTLAAEGSETRVWAVRYEGERLGSKPVPPEIVARFRQD